MVWRAPQRAVDQNREKGKTVNPGPFVAEVMRNDDPLYSGRLLVYVPDFAGDPEDESTWRTVRYMTPYYGVVPLTDRLEQNRAQAQDRPVESYGMWMTPPDVGTRVIVMFLGGDPSDGIWIGCLPEIGTHAAIPGQDKGDFDVHQAGNYAAAGQDIKSLEGQRPDHSTKPTFETQGLQDDKLRGPITSSSFRDTPSRVFGFNTPGSHSFVMDDGDQEGNSKLVRIRTAAGNQIMMNDDAGLIYIVNAQGTGWIEVSPSGQIDVYGEAGINLATPGDVNIHADKDVNINAGNSIKMVAAKGAKLQGTEECQLHGKKLFLQGVDSIEMHSCKEIKINSFKDIFMKACENTIIHAKCLRFNSGTVKEAEQVPPEKPKDVSGYQTTVARAPSKEPYKDHDGGSGGGGGGAGGAGGLGVPNLSNMASGLDVGTAAVVLGSGSGISASQAANLKFDDPSKPVAVFMGGVGSNLFNSVSPMARTLEAAGTHNVVLLNTGIGYSDSQLSAIANNFKSQGVVVDLVAGHSAGAVGARNFGAIFGNRINNMALIDAGSPIDQRMLGGFNGITSNVLNAKIITPSSGSTAGFYGDQVQNGNNITTVIRETIGNSHLTAGTDPRATNSVLGMLGGGGGQGAQNSNFVPGTFLGGLFGGQESPGANTAGFPILSRLFVGQESPGANTAGFPILSRLFGRRSSTSALVPTSRSGLPTGSNIPIPTTSPRALLPTGSDIPIPTPRPELIGPGRGLGPGGPLIESPLSTAELAARDYGGDIQGGEFGGINPSTAAVESLPGLSGSEPATAIPAQQGGGDTGSFEKGNNCEKPANCGTGGSGGPGQGSGVPDNLDTTLGQSPEDLQKTYDQLRDQGLTHEQAIGAMANIQRESGFKPGAIGDNGNSFGLYQFNRPGGRGDPFLAAVPDWQTNAAGQHRYMFTQDSLGKAYASRSFSSSLEAANNFTNTVEIPLNRASYTAPGGFNSRIVPKLEASIIRRP